MALSQDLGMVQAGVTRHSCEIYIVKPKQARKIAWERVLFPIVLLGCWGAHRGNVAAEAGIADYKQAVAQYQSERNAMFPR